MHEEPNKLLKRAVSEITFNINANQMDPHDAVVKVAKELDLNVHFIKRATEAINVALTHAHFKKHAEARDEDFPIVDVDKVNQEVFTGPTKTANEKKSEWFSSVDITDEVPNFNKILANRNVKKAYAEIITSSEKHDSFDVSEAGKLDKIALLQDKMENELNNLATKRAGAKYDLNHNFVKLANRFSRDEAYRSSFAEFEKQAYSLYGERAIPYIEFLYKSAELKEARGEYDEKYTSFETCHEAELLGTLLKSASELVEIENQHADKTLSYLKTRHQIKQAYHEMFKKDEEVEKVAETVEEPVVVAEEDTELDLDPVAKIAAEKIRLVKEAALEEEQYLTESQRQNLPQELKNSIIKSKKAGDDEPLDRLNKVAGLFDVAVEKYKKETQPRSTVPSTSYQDNLDRKLLLERMLVTDPILSSADPKRVVDAYEQFLHLAPEFSKEPEVVKGTLRSMIASQSLDPHTAQQFVEANSAFANQKMQQQGVGKK